MPIMDGITATRELRARGTTIPIIGLSASPDEATREEALQAGMNDLLAKPIAVAELKSVAQRVRSAKTNARSAASTPTEDVSALAEKLIP